MESFPHITATRSVIGSFMHEIEGTQQADQTIDCANKISTTGYPTTEGTLIVCIVYVMLYVVQLIPVARWVNTELQFPEGR